MATPKIPPPEELARLLREAGYNVHRRTEYVKKTFQVAKDVLKDFIDTYETLGYRVKEAATEAFAQWVESKRELVERKKKEQAGKDGSKSS